MDTAVPGAEGVGVGDVGVADGDEDEESQPIDRLISTAIKAIEERILNGPTKVGPSALTRRVLLACQSQPAELYKTATQLGRRVRQLRRRLRATRRLGMQARRVPFLAMARGKASAKHGFN
jgi:hypothetical protein